MTRRATILLLGILATTACGRKGARSSDFDSATAAAMASGPGGGTAAALASQPKTPHIRAISLGHRLAASNDLYGPTVQTFGVHDSVMVSVRTEFMPAGTELSARVRINNQTLDSVSATSGAPDTAAVARAGFGFGAPAKGWTKGTYQVDIFVDNKFQLGSSFQVP